MSLITPDFGLIFWMTIIFGILFFLLAKFGFPVITGMVEKRSERIENSIREAKEAEQQLEQLERRQADIVEKARLEEGRILDEARQAGAGIIAQAREQARKQAEEIVTKGREEIAAQKDMAARELKNRIADISLAVAGKVIRREISSDSSQKELLDILAAEAEDSPETK